MLIARSKLQKVTVCVIIGKLPVLALSDVNFWCLKF